jgi:hypothetical protein
MSSAGKSREFQRHSWKGGGKGDVDPRAARRVRRVVGTIAALGLFAWFAWLLWPHPVATTYVLCAAVDDYDVLQAPPLPFAVETIGEFEPLAKRPGVSLQHRQDVKTAKALADLFAAELPRGGPKSPDIVLVYLAAHGVSQSDGQGGAQAWLLGSDYGAMRDVGKVAIDDVLSALGACQARAKVLVLDAGSIENDPALGMAVNEFSALVAEKVSQLPEDDVWVLLSHRLFEKSHAAFADRRSVFGYYVARGLQGGPEVDRDADGVDLSELFDYVRDNVARYVWHASNRQETQTPVLVARGDLARAGGLKLTLRRPAAPASAPAEEKAEDKSQEKAEKTQARIMPVAAQTSGLALTVAAADEPAAPPEKSPPAGAEPAAQDGKAEGKAAQSKGPELETAGNKPPDGDSAPSASSDAKAKTDGAADSTGAKPQPDKSGQAEAKEPAVDPTLAALRHEWHACELRRDRSSMRWTPVDYAPRAWLRHVEQLKGYELRWLFGAASSPRRIGQGRDEADWNVLRRRFDDSLAKPSFEQHPALEAAVQLRDDLLFALRYYAAWSVGEGSTDDCLSLASQVGRLLKVLNEPPAPRPDGAQPPGAGQWLAELAALRDELEIETQRFDDRIRRTVRDCLDSKGASSVKTQRLLRLPWIAAGDRAKLVVGLQAGPRLEDKLPPPPSEVQSDQRARQLEQDAARRAGQLAHIQWQVLQLAGLQQESGNGDPVDEKLIRLEQSSRFDSRVARDVGFALAEAYQRLNRELASAAGETFPSPDDLEAVRLVESRARLADVRNQVDLADKFFWEIPFPSLAIDWKPNLVAIPLKQGTSETPLRTDADSEVSWRIGNLPPGPVAVTWSLEYDSARIAVAGRAKGTLDLGPGSSEAERTLTFLVRATGDQREASTASLTLRVEAPSAAPQTGQIALTLPTWQPIELSAVATDGLPRPSFKADERGIGKVVLMPLPSGKTLFHLDLHNPSPQERKIKYRLFALSKMGLSARSLGLWPLRPGGEWQPYAKAIQPAPVELTLPAKGKTRLSFPPFPKPPAPETPTPPSKTEAPMPEAEKGVPIGDGLMCEVTDLSTDLPAASQRFWIDVAPLHPRYYVIPSVRYNAQSHRIELAVKPRFAGRLLPNGSTVRWYSEGFEGDDLNPIGGVLAADQRELSLPSPPIDASKIPKNQAVHVLVDIDGYPRAFRYDVRCDRPSGDASETESAELRFLIPPSTPSTWLKNGTPIGVKLRADAPRAWFDGPGHFVEVGIHGDPRQTLAFDSDRRSEVLLLPAENDGDFLVDTHMDELQAEFRSDAYPDQEISLVTSLGSTADERTVGLDGNAPLVKPVTPRPIYEGSDMVLSLVVTDDRSGVDKVEAAVDADDSGEVKQWQRASEDEASPGTYTVTLPTKALPPRRWTALVQAKDLAGNTTLVERVRFDVVPKPGMAAGARKKSTTRVDATVTFNSLAASDFRGRFTGPKNGSVKADGKGQFSVELPPGGYKFEFEGVINNTKVKFSQELTVDAPSDKPQRATLSGP